MTRCRRGRDEAAAAARRMLRVEPVMGTMVTIDVRPPFVDPAALDDGGRVVPRGRPAVQPVPGRQRGERVGDGRLRARGRQPGRARDRRARRRGPRPDRRATSTPARHRARRPPRPDGDREGLVGRRGHRDSSGWPAPGTSRSTAGGDLVAAGEAVTRTAVADRDPAPRRAGCRSPRSSAIAGLAVATSGLYERGGHIRDPHTGRVPDELAERDRRRPDPRPRGRVRHRRVRDGGAGRRVGGAPGRGTAGSAITRDGRVVVDAAGRRAARARGPAIAAPDERPAGVDPLSGQSQAPGVDWAAIGSPSPQERIPDDRTVPAREPRARHRSAPVRPASRAPGNLDLRMAAARRRRPPRSPRRPSRSSPCSAGSSGSDGSSRPRHRHRARRRRPERGPRDRRHGSPRRPASSRRRPRHRRATAATGTATSTGTTTVTTGDLTAIVASAKESVVTITADGLTTDRFSPFGQPTQGIGSGIILTANGYILTNRHVTQDSTSLSVELLDGTTYDARLVEQATDNDLALIKIDATGLKPARIADSSSVKVGETAIAIGSPLGTYTETVTKGIVSGLGARRHRRRRDDRPPGHAHRPHPDRCGDQPRQQRRAAARRLGRRDRHQHRRRVHGPGPGLRDPHQRRRGADRQGHLGPGRLTRPPIRPDRFQTHQGGPSRP